MRLRELFTEDAVKLDLESETKEEALRELVQLLALDPKSEQTLFKTLKRRENLGSTGIGKGIAIPHCRSLVVKRLHLAYGRKYLPVLGKIAQFAKDPEVPRRLSKIENAEEFFSLLEEKAP